MVNSGIQMAAEVISLSNECALSPGTKGRAEQHDLEPAAGNGVLKQRPPRPEIAHKFTSAVVTVSQTFNEPRDPHRQKRQSEPAADYRAYKHIFIEGYRNGDGKEEEGRLHVDLAHDIILRESYDDYEGVAKLALDRLDLPRCESFGELHDGP
jgi:hypothetical protein